MAFSKKSASNRRRSVCNERSKSTTTFAEGRVQFAYELWCIVHRRFLGLVSGGQRAAAQANLRVCAEARVSGITGVATYA